MFFLSAIGNITKLNISAALSITIYLSTHIFSEIVVIVLHKLKLTYWAKQICN